MTDKPPKPPNSPALELRPFAAWLHEHNKGRTHDELGVALRDVAAAVKDTGKPGRLTLTIEIRPSKAEGAVTVTDKISTKIPALERPASIFYLDDADNLVRNDPHQTSIFDHQGHIR